MPHNPAYMQLLNLIMARSQQWLRHQVDQMPEQPRPDDPAFHSLAEIAHVASVCSGLRGTEAPLATFVRSRVTAGFLTDLAQDCRVGPATALFQFLPVQTIDANRPGDISLIDRLAIVGPSDPQILAEAEAYLCRPVPAAWISDDIVEAYAYVLALSYRFGAERPRFAKVRSYGTAFSTCLKLAEWAQQERRLLPLAQMCFCLRLIDPDHDLAPMLSDIIASQRPDGSFPDRIGYGTTEQDSAALRPTLATLTALHMAVHGRWRSPVPTVPMAA